MLHEGGATIRMSSKHLKDGDGLRIRCDAPQTLLGCAQPDRCLDTEPLLCDHALHGAPREVHKPVEGRDCGHLEPFVLHVGCKPGHRTKLYGLVLNDLGILRPQTQLAQQVACEDGALNPGAQLRLLILVFFLIQDIGEV